MEGRYFEAETRGRVEGGRPDHAAYRRAQALFKVHILGLGAWHMLCI